MWTPGRIFKSFWILNMETKLKITRNLFKIHPFNCQHKHTWPFHVSFVWFPDDTCTFLSLSMHPGSIMGHSVKQLLSKIFYFTSFYIYYLLVFKKIKTTHPCMWYKCILARSSKTGLHGAGSAQVAAHMSTLTPVLVSDEKICLSALRAPPPSSIHWKRKMFLNKRW